jgi:hypothetical protein
MNDSNIEKKIIAILSSGFPVRTQRLVDQISSSNKDIRGYSPAAIYRKIGHLKEQNLIIELAPEKVKQFGISTDDKRATYLVLKDYDERKDHLDRIISSLDTEDIDDSIAVFNELDRYKNRFYLTPAQLDKLKPGKKTDFAVIYRALRILQDHIFNKQIVPSDIQGLLKSLKWTLKRLRSESPQNYNPKKDCLDVLGFFNDNYVVDQLIADAENHEKIKFEKHYYESPYLARIIEKERARLFEFERSLRKKGKDEAAIAKNRAMADIFSDIRDRATHQVIYPQYDTNNYSYE